MRSPTLNILKLITKVLAYTLLLIIGLFFISLIFLSNTYRDFKSAYDSGLKGKNELSEAIRQAESRNWDEALKNSQAAEQSFSLTLQNLNASRKNIIIKKIPLFTTQVNDLEYLFKTTEIISRSLERSIPIIKELERAKSGTAGDNFVDLKNEEKAQFLKLIYESEPEINGLKANLDIALLNISKIHKIGILWPVYGQISEYKRQLQTATELMSKIVPLTRLLPALGGYPAESDFLILLQNNDELRPTGGFIGVFGLAKTKNGEIISLTTNDSYHLDMPAVGKWKKEPPAPIKKYLNIENWYLRDANWIPDWPLAAQKINEIYTGESLAIDQPAPEFAGIIAINPEFISNLINLVGPINVKGENYTPENFQELLQYNVEIAYKDRNISSWDRKEIINELLNQLQNRLFNLPAKDWGGLVKILDKDIAARNLQLYFNDQTLQDLNKNLGASGEMKKTASDYLMVVDANLAAFKSDAVVKKKIAYSVNQNNGKTVATLSLNYRHEGDFDWRTTRYRSYTRIYAPLGSRLTSVSGLNKDNMDLTTFDDSILEKTVFGFFFTVEPGTEREIILHYSLPDIINQQLVNNTYRLLIQKQSGRRTQELRVDLASQNKKVKTWTTDLNVDRIFKQTTK